MIQFEKHAFKELDASLRRLFDLLQSMGAHIQEIMALMPAALEGANEEGFASAKAIDKKINDAEEEADKLVTSIVTKFSTTGEELRFVIGSIKIAGNLERAADKAKNGMKHLARMNHPLPAEIKAQFANSIAAVSAMVPLCLKQVLDYQPAVTTELLKHGAAVQNAYRQITLLLHGRKGGDASDDTHILLVAKNLEQMSDLTVEIMKISHHIHFRTKYEKATA